jgi:acetyl esterase
LPGIIFFGRLIMAVERSERLHPEARALLELFDAQGGPRLDCLTPAEARIARAARGKFFDGDLKPLARIENIFIPGPAGHIPARLYAQESGGVRPALVYFHGGGFVQCNLETHDAICRALASESDFIVVSIDYRLAPEHRFPAAVDDAHAATLWIAAHAASLGIDAQRISVGGDSAGGTLAAVTAIRCRNAGAPVLASQILLCPVTDLSSFDTDSYREFAEGYYLTRAGMRWFAGHYLASDDDAHHPEASPLLAEDFTGLAPALVIAAELDPLRDEAEAYAQRLQQAGVPVTLSRYPGMIHAFTSLRGAISDGDKAIQEAAAFLRSTSKSS